ncbi:gypsy retrotransposon integrase-like protein 1 [Plakobranchus ocellatus]|uniref:Gypsy retrotransposon integrase-like protein 1 n=1 Tax=Plakobranchus ocellatus TaxID=259542 RepID=A0AAV3ZG91_9GAST|nr:gypsy retrotransposon integrase-like protein 1 [Plakobranchus ocellatus]
MKRYDMTEDGYRRKFRTCKPAEGESPDMVIVRIVTYLDRWIELSKTDKSYGKLKDLIVREQFMDACPEDLATSLREKDLPTLERVAKEADLFLKARDRKLCDQPRKVFQGNARPRMDSVRPLEPEKKFNGGQRAGRRRRAWLTREDPRILALVDARRTSRIGRKVVSFEKERGIVYRRYEDLGRNVDVKQMVLHKPLREYVMSVAHDSITGAHLRIRRTKDKILSNFYWPGIDGNVTRYCRSCDVCQRTVKKGTLPRVPLEKVPLIDTPFKRVAIDLVGPINPPSEAGQGFILTLVDYATRFAEAVLLHKIDTESVAEALKTTTPYHPICNGLVEKFNATLKTCLRRLCSEQPRQWHRYINPLLFPYREVPQESTHFAPFELLYRRTVRGPMHILRELWTKEIEEPDVKSSCEYVLNLCERLDDTRKIAREKLEKAQGLQKHYYDRTAKRRKFSVGEKVLVLLLTDSNKLLMQWKGPFEIVATVGINDYRINTGGKEKTFHANLLNGYFVRDQDASQATTDEGPPTSSSAKPAANVTVIEDLEG